MLGVVLCGGQSLRMGSDKGLLETKEGIVWSKLAYQKLADLNISAVLSINNQQKHYDKIFSGNTLIIDDISLKIKGPLLGLMSVHQQFPEENLFILACDMTDMKNEVLHFLFKRFKTVNAEALVFSNKAILEPLCGIYSSEGLRKIHTMYKEERLLKFSMQAALGLVNTYEESLPIEWMNSFNNYNSFQRL